MKRICVFAGSKAGGRPGYREAAAELGRLLAGRGIGLVYGAGRNGLMGAVADAALAGGGEVIGVIPDSLMDVEPPHEGVSELRIVRSMHARKALMERLSDGFIALPGGLGTVEETMEMITWAQLGYHAKPVGLLNAGGYFEGLLAFLRHASAEGFVQPANLELFNAEADPAALLGAMARYAPPSHIRMRREAEEG
ncbi:MAG: TIGR00730 family Rossman fold protein [Candidatus Tectomicrobia bacterium]|nr:TIGR00730 family Rossman fold protein [Candidatus Tectomicrobia bacterium]